MSQNQENSNRNGINIDKVIACFLEYDKWKNKEVGFFSLAIVKEPYSGPPTGAIVHRKTSN